MVCRKYSILSFYNLGAINTSGSISSNATSSSHSESLTSDSSIGDIGTQNMASYSSSYINEQLAADGSTAEDEQGALPHVIVIYLVNIY